MHKQDDTFYRGKGKKKEINSPQLILLKQGNV